MERPDLRGGQSLFFGQLKRDELIRSGAVALDVGISDPLAFMRLDGDDWDIGIEIIRQAQQMQAERRRDELKALSKSVADATAQAVAKLFR